MNTNPTIRVKRSLVSGKVPSVEQLGLGELAINHYDGKLFVRKDTLGVGIGTTVVQIGSVEGPQGFQGPQGNQGAQGSAGPQGAQGPQGTGPQGSQGSQGDQGGPQGAQGAQGFQGPAGDGSGGSGGSGPQGAQGSQGNQGVKGPQGPQGAQGSQGNQGSQGAQGAQGSSGSRTYSVTNSGASSYTIDGASNPTLNLLRGFTYTFSVNASGHPFWIKTSQVTGTGSAYSSGVTNNGTDSGTITFAVPYDAPSTLYYICQHHSGMSGTISITDVGPQGAQGAQGPQGVQGSQGPQGAQGFQGVIGPQGVQGPQGAQGFQGAGPQGFQGPQGAQGFQGAGPQGSAGPQGPQGAQGFQGASGGGPQGSPGSAGPQGPQGAQGFQGASGGGPQGSPGSAGPQGPQGAQGFQGASGGGPQGAQGSPGSTFTKSTTTYTATASQTTFNATYTVGFVDVYLNGIRLSTTEFTASNGTSIVLSLGASENDIVDIVAYSDVGVGAIGPQGAQGAAGINYDKSVSTFTVGSGQTSFNVAGGYTVGFVDVYLNGIRLSSSEYSATDGTSVILTSGGSLGDLIDIVSSNGGVLGAQGFQGIQGANGTLAGSLITINSLAETTKVGTGVSVTIDYDAGDGNIGIVTNPTGPISLYVNDIPTSAFNGKAIALTVVAIQTSVGYACSSIFFNGTSRTIRWPGGTVATGSTNCVDYFNFVGIDTIGNGAIASYIVTGNKSGGYK